MILKIVTQQPNVLIQFWSKRRGVSIQPGLYAGEAINDSGHTECILFIGFSEGRVRDLAICENIGSTSANFLHLWLKTYALSSLASTLKLLHCRQMPTPNSILK